MSGVNITILEGGKAENFGQVTKLRTDNGDGHDMWVPKVDVQTKSLSVKKNGLYYTKEYPPTSSEKKDGHAYDIYGWDTITVSVKKKVKGKKKKTDPSTGLDYDVPATVEVDDDGNLVEKEVPTSIRIVKEPTTTVYVDGYSISIAGIKVKAYLEDGSEWGDVPFNELSYEPTVASIGDGGKTGDLETSLVQPIKSLPAYTRLFRLNRYGFHFHVDFPCLPYYKDNQEGGTENFGFIAYSDTQDNCYIYNEDMDRYEGGGPMYPFTYDGKTVYYSVLYSFSNGEVLCPVPNTVDLEHAGNYAQSAWVALYGTPSGRTNEVTVTWDNDDLDEPLTDTYNIVVVPSPIPPNIEGGNNGDDTGGGTVGEDPDHPITPHI